MWDEKFIANCKPVIIYDDNVIYEDDGIIDLTKSNDHKFAGAYYTHDEDMTHHLGRPHNHSVIVHNGFVDIDRNGKHLDSIFSVLKSPDFEWDYSIIGALELGYKNLFGDNRSDKVNDRPQMIDHNVKYFGPKSGKLSEITRIQKGEQNQHIKTRKLNFLTK